ncbi:MAG TPA: hypothetical protein VMS55_23040 [Myxococcota bacterium]|nr:hypothetical protein [Myxococcota bacterium]
MTVTVQTARVRQLLPRLAVLAAAVALGLLLQRVVAARLDEIQALSAQDVIRARAELATLLRVGGALLFGFTAATGLAIVASSRRALATGRFPPPGFWSWGTRRVTTGPRARTLARTSLVLGTMLVACSAAGGGLVWYMASVLLACKAGVAPSPPSP